MTTQQILAERALDYGDYEKNITTCARVMELLEVPKKDYLVNHVLDIYVTKLVRIAVSPGHTDSHIDIAGYSTLNEGVAKEININTLTPIKRNKQTELISKIYDCLLEAYTFQYPDSKWTHSQSIMMEIYAQMLILLCRCGNEMFFGLVRAYAEKHAALTKRGDLK